jgi:hypothetical protein
MKTRLRFTFLSLLYLISIFSPSNNLQAQTETHDFITYDTTFNVGYAGLQYRFRISRPANMFTPGHPDTASRPAIITMPGLGEVGTNMANLQKYGPHYWMNNGWDGSVQLGNGTHYPIIITVMPSAAYPRGPELTLMMNHLLNTYRIKRNSVHVAGLSMGGFSWTLMLCHQASAGAETGMKLITSVVALQGVSSETFPPYDQWSLGDASWGRWAKKYGGKFFGLEGTTDVRNVWRVSENMNDSMPGSAYFAYENIGGGAHCCWNTMYDPSRNNWRNTAPMGPNVTTNAHPNTPGNYLPGSNIFQWMLRQGDTSLVNGVVSANQAPTANAGPDQTSILPVNLTLSGSGTDPDGTIASYQWTKIAGPASAGTILSPTLPVTLISTLLQGVYQFELRVTDDQGAIGKDTVNITINGIIPNQLPTANAGANQTITLPTSTVTLNGSGTDPDGTISSYQWTKIAGPTSFTIVSSTQAQTVINGLVQGVYQFELRVTDNSGATGLDTATVTVNAAPPPPPNLAPIANAGSNQAITLPTNSTTLTGSGNDPDGTVSSYQWTKIAGPSTFNIAAATQAQTAIGGLIQGTYQFEFRVTDNQGMSASDTISVTVNIAASSSLVVKNIGVTEYRVAYIASDSNAYSYINNAITKYNMGARKAVDVTAAGYAQLQILDDQGYVWTTQTGGATAPIRIETDTTGAAFNNNIAVFGYYFTNVSIRSDSSLWYWGQDNYNLYAGTNPITRPIKLSPAGMKVKKVAMGGSNLVVLLTNGQVWQWTRNGSLTPVQKTLPVPRPAIDIFAGQYDVNGCIIPDASGSQAMGYPYVWGTQFSYWGGNTAYTQPTSVRSLWNVTVPIKEIAANPNTIHYIDSLGRLFGIGDNPNGEVGNGYELVNKYTYPTPYAWSWNPNESLTGSPAIQIGNGITWNKLYKNNTISYYVYATDVNDSVYFWGRDKALVSGRGYINWDEAPYPNAMDVLTPLQVHPLQSRYQAYNFTLGTINAGNAQSITTSTTTLTGTATAPRLLYRGVLNNGIPDLSYSIVSYQWTKLSGPTCTIVSPSSATTAVTGLSNGTYSFRLVTTDNNTGTMADTVVVTVNTTGNISPTANAGVDQTITLPTSTVTLNGSGTDPDGTISSYQWTKIAGPTSFTIVSPTQAQTVVNSLVQGVYQFELRVTDNGGAIDRDTVVVTVNAAVPPPNQAPTANAGVDQTITLPTSTVTLNGSGTDPDGTISSYQWTKIAGPTSFTIVSPTQAQTVINSLVQGVYQFELRVTDNGGAIDRDTVVVTVNAAVPPVNQVPTANAGGNQTITLPTSSVTLTGSGTDPDGTITAYLWTKVSGPTTLNIVSPTQFQTVVNNLVQGVYQFELRITDNAGAFGRDTVMITVNAAVPPPNQAPTANAGANQTITLPTNSITATGSGTDPDGTITAYQWTKIAGPVTFNIVSPTQAQTVINNLVQGVYQFELRVTDNSGASARDTMTVTVNAAAPPPPNQAPTANAGNDQAITLPLNYLTLTGSGTDPDGTITAYQWTKIAGPASFNIVNASQALTLIDNLEEGIYQFELRVTDNQGATGRDTVTVTVNPDPRTQSDASVFPNPATSVINIRIDAITNQAKTTIRIYDARGMILYHEQFTRTQQVMIRQVDVSKFPNGAYFVKIDVDINNSKTIEFIKM